MLEQMKGNGLFSGGADTNVAEHQRVMVAQFCECTKSTVTHSLRVNLEYRKILQLGVNALQGLWEGWSPACAGHGGGGRPSEVMNQRCELEADRAPAVLPSSFPRGHGKVMIQGSSL